MRVIPGIHRTYAENAFFCLKHRADHENMGRQEKRCCTFSAIVDMSICRSSCKKKPNDQFRSCWIFIFALLTAASWKSCVYPFNDRRGQNCFVTFDAVLVNAIFFLMDYLNSFPWRILHWCTGQYQAYRFYTFILRNLEVNFELSYVVSLVGHKVYNADDMRAALQKLDDDVTAEISRNRDSIRTNVVPISKISVGISRKTRWHYSFWTPLTWLAWVYPRL